LAFLILALLGQSAGAAVPRGFLGICPQTVLTEPEMAQMSRARITTMRLPLYWSNVEARDPSHSRRNWSWFDVQVAQAAEAGITVLPFVWGSPRWVAPSLETEPTGSRDRKAWSAFLRQAAARYGPQGTFWALNPEVPRRPIRRWQIWNEPNIVTFSRNPDPARYAMLVRTSARALHSVDPAAKVILAGVFGEVTHIPPNVDPVAFIDRVYKQPQAKRFIDGIALHPYLARAQEMYPIARELRRVLKRNQAARTGLWITEMGWGSDAGESRWERGKRGQVRQLNRAMSILSRRRRAWRVRGVYWFTWRDQTSACQFCDSAGLFTQAGDPKRSWYAFNFWTGGDPRLQAG
jgi:hypothetical protein